MRISQTINTVMDHIAHIFHEDTSREKKTKKYTRQMIKKYGKTLRRLSRE